VDTIREVGMFERMSLMLGRLMTLSAEDFKREDGQGATEYAMVIAFVVVGLTVTLGLLGGSIQTFLGKVGDLVEGLV
jgi:Flp pilus assembly pilin Flp